jgi:hypothetical protein
MEMEPVNFFVGEDSHSLAVSLLSGDGPPDIAVAGSHLRPGEATSFGYNFSVLINNTL